MVMLTWRTLSGHREIRRKPDTPGTSSFALMLLRSAPASRQISKLATLSVNVFASLETIRFGFDRFELGQDMKFLNGLVAAVLLMAGVGASHAAVLIVEDHGGRIGVYMDKYQGLRSSGETVVLGAVPHDKICVTSYANLGFHAAWDFGPRGRTITNREATQMLYSMYPSPIRRWIAQRGGLRSHMIFLRGKQLARMYKPCYLDAQASAHR